MEFREILDRDFENNIIALGTRQGGMLTVDIDKYPSIVITGETGSGKSIMLDQIILQMINKYTSEDLRLVLVDTTGVELNYYKDSNYRLLTAMNDLDKAQEVLAKVIEEVDRRKKLLKEYKASSIDEYNRVYNHKIPKLLIAIDDNKSLLDLDDINEMLKKIISDLDNLGILFVLATNDMHNKFFDDNTNTLSKILISFDTANIEEATNSNIPFSNDLLKGNFIIYKDGNYEEYQNMDFDDNIIKEILD